MLLVVLYSLLYYRGLGFVTVGSLLVAGSLVYLLFLLLGKWIGFTLTLAGIAGAIVAIGVTADSFIIYFERVRDELREGRSLRTLSRPGRTDALAPARAHGARGARDRRARRAARRIAAQRVAPRRAPASGRARRRAARRGLGPSRRG